MTRKDTRLDKKGAIEPLWDTWQTAKYLGVSRASLRRWLAAGEGPRARKIGVQVRYRPADVHAWVESR